MQFCAGRVPSLQHLRVGGGDGYLQRPLHLGLRAVGVGVSFSSTPSQTAKLGVHDAHTHAHTCTHAHTRTYTHVHTRTRARTHTHTHTHTHTKFSFPRTRTDQERGYYPTPISQTITKVKDMVSESNQLRWVIGMWWGEAEDAGNRDAQPYHLPCPREGHTSWGEGNRGWRRGVSNH